MFNYQSGRVYKGNWRDGKRTGRGELILPSGDRFIGDFVDNYITGPNSECYFSDGSVYKGAMVNSKKKGKESSSGALERDMLEISKTASEKDTVCTILPMELFSRVTGKMISNMDTELSKRMERSRKESGRKESRRRASHK